VKKFFIGLLLSLFASASFAQSTITFNVVFDRVLQASGAQLPFLYDSTNDPLDIATGGTTPIPNLTGTVTLTAVASSTQLTSAGPNEITLNGSWTDEFAFAPPENWLVHTYENATFDLFQTGGKFANDFSLPNPQPIFIGSDLNGLLSDHGPVDPCPFPTNIFNPPAGNCFSDNPALTFGDDFDVFDTGSSTAIYPGLADLGQHDLISGTYSLDNMTVGAGIGHDNGLDGFYFEGELCTGDLTACGGGTIAPGGIVRIVMTSDTGNTMYVVEGTVAPIPLPAAAYLFPAGLIAGLGWMRRRRSTSS